MTCKPIRSEQAIFIREYTPIDLTGRSVVSEATSRRGMPTSGNNVANVTVLLSLLCCVLLPGCTVCQNAKRTVLGEPSEYSWMEDRKQSVKVYRSWADRAWYKQCSADSGQSVSSAYEAGFKDGFVDYVFAGGSGEPPPVPPRQFWNVGRRNQNGHAEATEWFAGYRNGAQVAHDEGYREQAIVPASVFLGPQKDCRENQPCFVEPFISPMPEKMQPELLPPGPLESDDGSDEFSPLVPPSTEWPSAETPIDEAPSLTNPAVEAMPLPNKELEKSDSSQSLEPSERTPAVPQPSPNPKYQSPKNPSSPESSPSIDELFDSSAFDRSTPKPNRPKRLRQTNFEQTTHEVSASQPATTPRSVDRTELMFRRFIR